MPRGEATGGSAASPQHVWQPAMRLAPLRTSRPVSWMRRTKDRQLISQVVNHAHVGPLHKPIVAKMAIISDELGVQ